MPELTKRQATLISCAATRVQMAAAEAAVASAHLRARKVGTSPQEYYDLQRISVELDGVRKRLREQLGEPG